jgi:hypothetical protein
MRKEYGKNGLYVDYPALAQLDFPGYIIKPDTDMRFFSYHNDRLLNGEKTSTLRFSEGAIRVPQWNALPWIETTPERRNDGPRVGSIYIYNVIVSAIRDLTKEDLSLDGYRSKRQIQQTVEDIWGTWPRLDDVVSIYCFEASEDGKE